MGLTNQINESNFQANHIDQSILILGNNDFITGTYTNGTGSEKTIEAGTVFGRIHASGLLLPLESDATDGSQFPVGILVEPITVANGASKTLTLCNGGDVEESKLVFENGTDDLDTVVSARNLRDRIAADTKGIRLFNSDELSAYDNV